MRRLTELNLCLRRLLKPPPIVAGAGKLHAVRLEIDRLAGGGSANLPLLLTHVLDRRAEIATAAGQALESLLWDLAPDQLPRLVERLGSYMVPGRAWLTLKPRQLEHIYRAGTVPFSFCCLATGHPNGHVREAAVRLVAATSDPRAMPLLLIRANDWVREVRAATRAALEALVDTASTESWVANLPLVLRLERCRRDDHRPLVARVVAKLVSPGAEAALTAGMSSPHRAVRRAAFEVGAERRRPSLRFLSAALSAGDPVVRLRAARLACRRMSGEALVALAEKLSDDPFPAVRMLALEIHRRRPSPEARTRLLRSLHDPNATIRGACQYYLRRDFSLDCAEEYRRAITGGASRSLAASLYGLAETCPAMAGPARADRAADAALAIGLLSHPLTRVRVAAVRAGARLDPQTAGRHVAGALADHSARVARAARDTLIGSMAAAHAPAIRAVFRTAPHLHSRRCAIEALARSNPWTYLEDLLAAASDPAPEIVEWARPALRQWLQRARRHAVRPSAAQLEGPGTALDACAERLGPEIAGALRCLLRTAG